MRYREYSPGPALRGVVHRFWTLRGAAGPADFQRAMPDGRPELIFNLADRFEARRGGAVERQPAALLVGPTTRALMVRPTGRVDLVGVRLAPGVWPRLLGLPGSELLDRALELPQVARGWREDLLEPLAEATEDAERLRLVAARLLRAVASSPPGDARLQAAVALTVEVGVRRVPRLAEQAGISPRQLGRLFREGTGMGPGLLSRLTRFQRVLAELERPAPVHWSALAHRHGYCDQAHLCRDFGRFAGIPPARYLAATRDLTRHFIDRDGRIVQDAPATVP
jgi:AraC-like DNA-binding protein